MGVLRLLKGWQVGLLLAALAVAVGGVVAGYALATRSGQPQLAVDEQLVPVQYGDLVNQVSTNGALVFPNREVVTFGVQGTVGEVMVSEGQAVKAGDILATLDDNTLASLQKAVAQAGVNLQSAQDAVAAAQAPPTAVQVAQAEVALANARLSARTAADALDALLNPASDGAVKAEAAIASAQKAVRDAQKALDAALAGPTDADRARAEAAVVSARLSLRNAQDALAAAVGGPSEDAVAKATAAVNKAQTSVDNANADLKLSADDWTTKTTTAQDARDVAREVYRNVFLKWLGAAPGDAELDLEPLDVLANWSVDLEALYDPTLRFRDVKLGWFATGLPSDDPATPWNEQVVYTWLNFGAGPIVAVCSDDVAPFMGTCISKEMSAAWGSYTTARNALSAVETQASKALANAGSVVEGATEGLASAQQALADLYEATDALTIESKQSQVTVAEATLAQAEEDLAALSDDPDPFAVASLRAQVALAQSSLDKADADLAALADPPDPLDVDARQRALDLANANLTKAEDDRAALYSSADPLAVSLKTADVASADQALKTALAKRDGATLRAPIAGVLSVVNVAAGDSVAANTAVAEIVDTSIVELDGVVDEIDVLYIGKGARAQVTMDALPGQTLQGIVSSLATAARSQQGVVTYPVRIQVEVPQGVELREGLSATATIITYEERNVLLVPMQALYGTYDQPLVRVMTDGTVQERPVALGGNDDFWVAVTNGLAAGETVVMQSQQATTSQFGVGAAMRGMQIQGQLFTGQGGGAFRAGR